MLFQDRFLGEIDQFTIAFLLVVGVKKNSPIGASHKSNPSKEDFNYAHCASIFPSSPSCSDPI